MATLCQPQAGFWKSIAGSLAFHAIIISLALFVYKGEPKVFFTPAYTVDLVGRPATPQKKETRQAPPSEELPQKEEPPKAEPPKQETAQKELAKKSEPEKADNTVRLKVKEKPEKEDVSEALSRIRENVKKKEDQEALSSSIDKIRKKKESEAKENAKKLDELRKRLLARESSQNSRQPSAPSEAPGAPGPARTDMESKYPAYYGLIRDKVQANWTGLEEYGDNTSVIVSIKISKNGQLISSWVEKSSGNQRFDKSLLNAIKKAAPFPPLPHEFDGDYLETGFRFCPNCPV